MEDKIISAALKVVVEIRQEQIKQERIRRVSWEFEHYLKTHVFNTRIGEVPCPDSNPYKFTIKTGAPNERIGITFQLFCPTEKDYDTEIKLKEDKSV